MLRLTLCTVNPAVDGILKSSSLQTYINMLLSPSPQAGLDKMSKGHMLADVVAIIGMRPVMQ